MADNMMRVAGKNAQNKAESLNIDSNGHLKTGDATAHQKLDALITRMNETLEMSGNVQLTGGTVQYYYEGNSNHSKTYASEMRGVSIANDGMENLTFTINGVTRTVYAGEPYNGILPPFTQIQIKAADKYRLEVLG